MKIFLLTAPNSEHRAPGKVQWQDTFLSRLFFALHTINFKCKRLFRTVSESWQWISAIICISSAQPCRWHGLSRTRTRLFCAFFLPIHYKTFPIRIETRRKEILTTACHWIDKVPRPNAENEIENGILAWIRYLRPLAIDIPLAYATKLHSNAVCVIYKFVVFFLLFSSTIHA